jgi:hypothetical protein
MTLGAVEVYQIAAPALDEILFPLRHATKKANPVLLITWPNSPITRARLPLAIERVRA